MKLYLGIDPGVSGGIAAVDEDGDVVGAWPMPSTEADVLAMFRELGADGDTLRAVLELVRSSPQMGVVSAFTFGKGYGGATDGADGGEDPVR